MRNQNYVFDRIEKVEESVYENATLVGVAIKSGILLGIAFIATCLSIVIFNGINYGSYFLYFLAAIATVVLQLVISFNPHTAKTLSIPYVICEGFMIGVICELLEIALPNEGLSIACFALMITLGILIASILLYSYKKIRLSPTFIKVLLIVLVGIVIASFLFSIISLVLYITSGISLWAIYLASPLSLIVSIIMVIISAIYVYITIQNVHQLVESGMDKSYEWYAAFGVAISIIWLFLDVLRLLIRIAASKKD